MLELNVAALAAAETLINKALRYDPASKIALQKLAGKILHVQISQPELNVYICPRVDQLDLQAHCDLPVHCKISGRLKDLVALAAGDNFNFSGTGVTVTGQTNLLLNLRDIVANLDVDWEDWLASYTGDEIANPLAKMVRKTAGFVTTRLRETKDNIEPYLSEELALLPTKVALENFASQVESLQQNTERFEAKLQALARKIQQNNSPA
ncbi:SCP2 sterol-binding domain-containing protein [Simiduia curdlanivorans]|uniref:Ubiquinone biosynthesis accessory factor UbiJ n=1 Tax=Simiduia curdlanivorans TaxID=1492769 RepID=A0ABV8V573_9GAMM|nr:SCP2 sterol-binding domain-containing protein [Simiduia curdlanivorans]MDN3637311.1 SCP2 sterol-binding domain-containing protein [Simiduia curdlanivorans]